MKLIIGLGNPGEQYAFTRHNLGFEVLDRLQEKYGFNYKEELSADFAVEHINGEKVIFACPKLYMNNSGQVVKGLIDYFKVDLEDILVIYDDKDQDFTSIKVVNEGGHGGHNGIRNIIDHIGNKFLRVKGGIGSSDVIDTKDYVLMKWNKEQSIELPFFIETLSNIADDFINGVKILDLQNKYNGKQQ